jgi:ribosomal protein S27E
MPEHDEHKLSIKCTDCGGEDFTFSIAWKEKNGCLSCDGCGREFAVIGGRGVFSSEAGAERDVRQEGLQSGVLPEVRPQAEADPVKRGRGRPKLAALGSGTTTKSLSLFDPWIFIWNED